MIASWSSSFLVSLPKAADHKQRVGGSSPSRRAPISSVGIAVPLERLTHDLRHLPVQVPVGHLRVHPFRREYRIHDERTSPGGFSARRMLSSGPRQNPRSTQRRSSSFSTCTGVSTLRLLLQPQRASRLWPPRSYPTLFADRLARRANQRRRSISRSMTPCSSGIISLALANDFLMRDFHFLGSPSQRASRRAFSVVSVKAY